MNAINRLLELQAGNDQAAAYILEQSPRFERIAGTAPRSVSYFNLFQTPEAIARMMVDALPNRSDPVILEPSAGLGNLYRAAVRKYSAADFHLVELSKNCAGELYRQNLRAELYQADFLQWIPPDGLLFDIVIMNPPFKNGEDVKHIIKAASHLKPGGFLISLCYDGVKQNKVLKPMSGTWQTLPAGSFREAGTSAGVVMMTIQNQEATK